MKKYVCDVCGYIYDPAKGDPDNGVKPGTAWEDIPASWVCPDCGASIKDFSEQPKVLNKSKQKSSHLLLQTAAFFIAESFFRIIIQTWHGQWLLCRSVPYQ